MSGPGAVQSGLAVLSQALVAQGRVSLGSDLAAILSGAALALRDLDEAGSRLRKPRSWWGCLLRRPFPVADYLRALDGAAVEIDRLAEALRQEEERLSAARRALEALDEQAGRLAQEIETEIAVREARLAVPDGEAPCDQAPRQDLERQLHELRLTRTVLKGSAISIQSMIDANAMLARRVATVLCTTLPAWELQTAHLVAAARAAPGQSLPQTDLERLRAASDELMVSIASASS